MTQRFCGLSDGSILGLQNWIDSKQTWTFAMFYVNKYRKHLPTEQLLIKQREVTGNALHV